MKSHTKLSFDNILQEQQQIGTQSVKSVASVYDVLSFRTSLVYPIGTKTITYEPDDLNRILNVKNGGDTIAGYTYAGPGRVTARTYLNGTSLSVDYDDGRRAITYTHGATIGGFGYSFDKMNNKLYENRTFEGKGDAFKYDEIYRLTGVKYGVTNLDPMTTYDNYNTYDDVENYDLDGVGNRLEVGNGSVSTTYTANTLNQYQTISDTELTTLDYDANGNLRWDGVIICTYNYLNQLTKVIRSDDEQILGEYKYDCLGRRIYKRAWNDDTESFTETNFYYDGVRCIEEQTTGGTTIATYVFGNGVDEVLTMDRNSETYYYHENSLGSIYAVTTATGIVAERYSYDAYGNVSFFDADGNSIVTSTIGNHILFTGREFDEETGLYYYRARYYSAEQGRFLSRDPAADDGLLNLYTYVANSPYNFTDPTGLRLIIDGKEIIPPCDKLYKCYKWDPFIKKIMDEMIASGIDFRFSSDSEFCAEIKRQRELKDALHKWNTELDLDVIRKQIKGIEKTVNFIEEQIKAGQTSLIDYKEEARRRGIVDIGIAGIGAIDRSSRPEYINKAIDDAENPVYSFSLRIPAALGLGAVIGIADVITFQGTKEAAKDWMTIYLLTEEDVHMRALNNLHALEKKAMQQIEQRKDK
jgi:RHS repeat-associated protein